MDKKQTIAIVAVIIIVVAAIGAYAVLNKGDKDPTPESMVDAAGNEIKVPDEVKTITAASPSIADVVCYLGYGDNLVCVSKYCTNSAIPSTVTLCGSYSSPDSDAISTANADVTFIDGSGTKAKEVYESLRTTGMNVVLIYGSDDGAEGAYLNVDIVGYVMKDYKKADGIVDEMKDTIESLGENTAKADETVVVISTGLSKLATDENGNWTNLDSFDGSGVYIAGSASTLSELASSVSKMRNPISGSSWVAADSDLISTSMGDVDVLVVLWTNKASVPNDAAVSSLIDKMKTTAWANCGAVNDGNIVFIAGDAGSDLSRVTPYTVLNALPMLSVYLNPECYSATSGGKALTLDDLPTSVDNSNIQKIIGYSKNKPA